MSGLGVQQCSVWSFTANRTGFWFWGLFFAVLRSLTTSWHAPRTACSTTACPPCWKPICCCTPAEGKYRTGDLGGKSTCSDYTKAIIDELD